MPTSDPNQIVLAKLLKSFGDEEYPNESPNLVFDRFATTQILKPKEVSADELADGSTDGSGDGGIDGFYVFLNGALLRPEDTILIEGHPSLRKVGMRPDLEIFLVQAKDTPGWEESVWEHLLASLDELLNIQKSDVELEQLFRASVVERTGILRKAIVALGEKFPKVTFRAIYATRAPLANMTEGIKRRSKQVAKLVEDRLTVGASVTVEHVGVRELYELAGTDLSKPGVLQFEELIRSDNAFVGLVTLESYLAFVRTGSGALREELFDSNVRGFEGDNVVNEAIADTLAHDDELQFWWLNNGVTVLGDNVDSPNKKLTVSHPLVVNGLQTSHVLHRAQRDGLLASERLKNSVIVRVIVSVDEEARDRIIAGTNRQTQVPGPALYATQPLQREIERFLLAHDWYYERRKNQYRNKKKPAKRRISILLLAQAMIAMKLGLPDAARARPSNVLLQKDGYSQIFSDGTELGAYLAAVTILKGVDDFLMTTAAKKILDEYTNSRFYVAAGYTILTLKIRDTAKLRFEKNFPRLTTPLKEAALTSALTMLASTATRFQRSHANMSRDAIFKNADFRGEYFENLVASLPKGRAGSAANATAKKSPAKPRAAKAPGKRLLKK